MNDHLSESLLTWGAGAVALFWFVGAHNRLVRLRAAALQAYATLDAALLRQLEFVQAQLAQPVDERAEVGAPGDPTALRAALAQLGTLLAATRLQPLDASAMAALSTALHILLAAWRRLYPEAVVSFEADGTLSRPAPLSEAAAMPPASATAPPIAWPEPSAAAEIARSQFNLAVAHYNAAIAQFPAWVVARIFRLRPAAQLA